ncbi:MAG: aminoacyl-tRNA hydrolase [Firmicutes bacterium]|nr:aminoacyl-tRNA hydrolase [Bacillota bacterium]
MALKLIVGLGNPGDRYRMTRHNMGFLVLDAWAERVGTRFRRTRYGLVASHAGLWALKPQTFMNLSGEAVGPFCRDYAIKPVDILVVVDDLDLPLGELRIRLRGSSGGHNGLKSIIDVLGSQDFPRMRLGISRPPDTVPVIDWVLGRFAADDMHAVQTVIDRAVDALETARSAGLEAAMNRYNG